MTFTEDFDRRLRLVLAAKSGKVISAEAKVTIETTSSGSEDDSRGLDRGIEVLALGVGMFASVDYEEPDAWLRLLADLEAAEKRP